MGSGFSSGLQEEEGCCWGSCSGGYPGLDGLHAQSSSASTLQLIFGLWHHPSWCSGLTSEHEVQCCSWGLLVSLLVCAHLVWLSVSSLFHPHTPPGNPYREARTQLLSAFTLGSCSSLALGLFSESSLVWRQASLPEGHRSLSQSSRLDPWCKECIRSRVHLPVVAWRLLGEVMSWLLGSSSPGFLWTHLPRTPDFLLHLCGMADVACMLYLLCLTIVRMHYINQLVNDYQSVPCLTVLGQNKAPMQYCMHI